MICFKKSDRKNHKQNIIDYFCNNDSYYDDNDVCDGCEWCTGYNDEELQKIKWKENFDKENI